MENRARNVINYYVLCNKLKNVIRTGWKNWNIKRERIESVAEHIFGVQQLAIAMWSEYKYDIDIKKTIFMIAIHELEEIIIGDLTPWNISREKKLKEGHEAISLILKDMLQKEQLENLILEFDAKQTKEALFAYYCDKLECDIQSKLYDEEKCVDLSKQENNPVLKDENIQKDLRSGKTWSEMWMQYGRKKYKYDENFTEVSEYIEKHKIS